MFGEMSEKGVFLGRFLVVNIKYLYLEFYLLVRIYLWKFFFYFKGINGLDFY